MTWDLCVPLGAAGGTTHRFKVNSEIAISNSTVSLMPRIDSSRSTS